MATIKQEQAAKRILENLGNGTNEPEGKVLLEVGYSPAIAKNPKMVTESKGFKEVLEKAGLTPELISTALADDIKSKPGKRVQELNLAADVLRMKGKDTDSGDKNLTINFISFNGNNDSA